MFTQLPLHIKIMQPQLLVWSYRYVHIYIQFSSDIIMYKLTIQCLHSVVQ